MQEKELLKERTYTAQVQQLLMAALENTRDSSNEHLSSIKALLADAWEELRLKPTALSEQDMEQLATEVDRFLARKALNDDFSRRYEKMLLNPFFARVDFKEDGADKADRIVIGLYSLPGPGGELMVHDWRAPVCSLYYDDMPGKVQYQSPSGTIKGVMSLKRQYKMERGILKYYVDTDLSIDDQLLLDILSASTHRHIRQIVSTIQSEQNRAIRCSNRRLLSVVGGAGSGKTSVAMHRAAFLMYRYRDKLDAKRIMILSPSNSFSEYISGVLPELGEENALTITLYKLLSDMLPGKLEHPLMQTELLLDEQNTLRRDSVRYKSGLDFLNLLKSTADTFALNGPEFTEIKLKNSVLATAEELTRMYRSDFTPLPAAIRLERIKNVLESRLHKWEYSLLDQYRNQLHDKFRGKDLENAAHFAVSHTLQPVRAEIRRQASVNITNLYAEALKNAPEKLSRAAKENAEAGIIWWEDAPALAYMSLICGFAQPDKTIRHLIMDEAQDYSACTLAFVNAYYSLAHVTLLGDPKQRTCPALPELNISMWNECFGEADAPVMQLTRCYRSTLNITRLCNAILPDSDQVLPFGREGDMPQIIARSDEALLSEVKRLVDSGVSSIAVITRSLKEADRVSRFIPKAHLLDGSDEDILSDPDDIAVGCYHLMKGLEFDAVIVCWPQARLSDGERRRLYTACSRALHKLTLLADEKLIEDLGIIL